MKYCHKCSTPWEGRSQPGARDICPKCLSALRCCFNCKFYDSSKSNQCFATVEEPVVYKDRSNFCEEFVFAEQKTPPQHYSDKNTGRAKDAFNNLFKKK
jgi:hypothetical protein